MLKYQKWYLVQKIGPNDLKMHTHHYPSVTWAGSFLATPLPLGKSGKTVEYICKVCIYVGVYTT